MLKALSALSGLKLLGVASVVWAMVCAGSGFAAYRAGVNRERDRQAALVLADQQRQLEGAREQLAKDQANALAHADTVAKLTARVVELSTQPPKEVLHYAPAKPDPDGVVRCPVRLSDDFVRDWNSANAAARSARPAG